jgi:hypothetical protein
MIFENPVVKNMKSSCFSIPSIHNPRRWLHQLCRCSSNLSIVSSTATRNVTDYGWLESALCGAFLDKLNKRRGGAAIESTFQRERNDHHAVAIFDEKGSDWCAGGKRATTVKIAVPDDYWK